jgi:hypothetical protein
MADKIVSLEFNVKTAGAVTEINKVTKATEGATAATIDYEKQLNDIKKATDGGGFKDLSRALKEYQDIALKAGETTPIGRQALAEAGELKDRLLDLKGAIKTTGQDGLALQGSLQLGGGIVAGFGAVQGVMALVGSESEDLQKTLVKLQAVQATLASVEEIRSVLEKESALRIMAVTVAEKARTAATIVSTFVTNGSTLALKAFRVALIGTGIGAIVVLLIAAADAMGLFGDSADDAAKKVEDLNKKLEKQSDLTKKLNEDIDNNAKVQKLKAQIAGKTEADIIQIEKEAQAEKTKNLYNYYLQTQKANDSIKANQKASAEDRLTFLKNEQDAYNTWQNSVNETLIINLEKEKELADNAREKEKEAEDKRKEKAKKDAAELKRINDERIQSEYEARADALLLFEKLDEEEKNLKYKKIADEAEALIIAMNNESILAEEKKKQRDKDLAEEIRIRDAKVQIANDLQSTLTDLGNLIINDSAKAVKFNKAMALIQIGIDTATALSKALSVTQSPSPDNVATGGLAGVAKYAGIAAMIFANAAKAKQILSSGNASGQAPTLGGGGGSAPTQAMQTQAPQTPGRVSNLTGSQTTTVKAIVVESDITTTQKRINSIQEIAKI